MTIICFLLAMTDKATGKKGFGINLTDYFAMTAMEGNNWGVQEYPDRQDEHKIVFFFAESSSDLWQAIQIPKVYVLQEIIKKSLFYTAFK